MKHFHELPRPTILRRYAWARAEDRMNGVSPDRFRKSRKGNNRAVSEAMNVRPGWRNTADRKIALFTPNWRRQNP